MIRLEEKIIYEADFILHGKRTMPEVADALKINIRTLQIHINEKLKDIDLNRYQMVREHLAKITTERQKVGGTIGKKTTSYNMDLVNLMADDMISSYEVMSDSNMQVKTLKDLEAKYNIPTSTIYELFMKYLDKEKLEKIRMIFNYNRSIARYSANLVGEKYGESSSGRH